MKKKNIKQIIVLVFALVGVIYRFYGSVNSDQLIPTNPKSQAKSRSVILTKHAKCRMDCRHIDMSEIKLALRDGKINYRKSEPKKSPCPVFAREVYSAKDKQQIRVVSADCGYKSTIITVIDLSNDYKCTCY